MLFAYSTLEKYIYATTKKKLFDRTFQCFYICNERCFVKETGRRKRQQSLVAIIFDLNLRSGSIFVSLGETFRREGRNEK